MYDRFQLGIRPGELARGLHVRASLIGAAMSLTLDKGESPPLVFNVRLDDWLPLVSATPPIALYTMRIDQCTVYTTSVETIYLSALACGLTLLRRDLLLSAADGALTPPPCRLHIMITRV